jgi:hypothetical protein
VKTRKMGLLVVSGALAVIGLMPTTANASPAPAHLAAGSASAGLDAGKDGGIHIRSNGEWCGRQCDGQDPETYVYRGAGGPQSWRTCGSDAITIKTIPANTWGVGGELRYSPFCETTWARSSRAYALRNESYYTNGQFRSVTEAGYDSGNGTHYTQMLDDHGLANRACAYRSPSMGMCSGKF